MSAQINLQKKIPKLRRYTLKQKLFSLALMKQSPKGYRFLSNVFALPSRKTLLNIMQRVPLHAGINKIVMEGLKRKLINMGEFSKYCVTVFDEIALEPSLLYNTGSNTIDGFQDNGSSNRTKAFADKAMVFMTKGTTKKWKLPLAYYFNAGGMKVDNSAVCLKGVIREVKGAGLKVIGAICDQASANVKAIRTLYEGTQRIFISSGQENRNFGFLIDDEEVVPVYDPPHSLKGIRNNLFDNDCRFKCRNNKIEVAFWNDIHTMYNLEEVGDDYRMCSKLTDIHIHNSKKIKVSIAAQVLSHRVAALMRGLARLGNEFL